MEKPDYNEVLKALVPIHSKWNLIGLGLEVPTDFLNGLQQSHQDNKVKLSDVLTKWIELNGEHTPVIWETIIDVVKGPYIENYELATEIHESLKQESTRQQSVTCEYKL